MRLIFAARVKNHVPAGGVAAPLKRVMAQAIVALDAVAPWPAEHTVDDIRWTPSTGRVGI